MINNFECYNKILVAIAKRNGSKYDNIWYSDEWTNMLGPGITLQIHKCFICNVTIIEEPVATYRYLKQIVEELLQKHGLQHLNEMHLLSFT